MSTPRRPNIVLFVHEGLAFVDVSTAKFPNRVTIIDEIDLPKMLDGFGRWYVTVSDDREYVRRMRIGDRKRQRLHRHLLGIADENVLVDHENADTLNNRRRNIRVATHQENARNCSSTRGSTSKYLGVSWYSDMTKWRAQLSVRRKTVSLGLHFSEEAAARAYDAGAKLHFGKFARLNFPDETRAAAA